MNVFLGDTITYTISIQNNSNQDYEDLVIYEYPDSVVTVLDNLNNYNNNELSWKIKKIKAGEKYTIKYKVMVPDDKTLNGKIIHSTGKVENITNTNIYHYVGKSLLSEDKAKLYEVYKSNTNLSDLDYINNIYKQIGYDINLNNIDIADIIEYKEDNSLLVKNTKIKDSKASNMIFGNYYGLEVASNSDASKQKVNAWLSWRNRQDDMTAQIVNTKEVMVNYANRAKTINKNILEVGDIIILKSGDVQKSYIYINDSLLIRKNQDVIETYEDEDLNVFLRDLVGKNYVLLRPALSELKKGNEIDDDKKDDVIIDDNKKDDTIIDDNNKNTEDNIENPRTGVSISIVAILVLLVGGIALLYYTKKKSIIKKI